LTYYDEGYLDRVRDGVILARFHDEANDEDKTLAKSISSPPIVTETFGQSQMSSTILNMVSGITIALVQSFLR
jgi:hypothetical protein